MQTVLMPKAAIVGTTAVTGPFIKLSRPKDTASAGSTPSIQLVTDGTVDGAWAILGSNKTDCDVNGDTEASDITAAFEIAAGTAIATVAHGTAATQSQGVQPPSPLAFAGIAARFTPTGGAGNRAAYMNEAI